MKKKIYAAVRAAFRFIGPVVQRVLIVLIIDWIKDHVGWI